MKFWEPRAMFIILFVCVLSGCQQRVSFPPEISLKNVDSQKVIIEGHLDLVKHHADGEVVTLDFSKDVSRPNGKLYPDFLVLSRETKGPQQEGKSGVSQVFERTSEVIPTHAIVFIKFFEKGMTIRHEL